MLSIELPRFARTQWWIAVLGDRIIWAQLRVQHSGTALVFDCDGNTLSYDSEDTAHAALLDAEFRALDGLDDDDALQLGIDLQRLTPPSAENDTDLRERMVQPRQRRQ